MKRELWLDYSRAFACLLVAVGHLVMSFQDSVVLGENAFASCFIDFLYYFHVYIFFFCSGYLFQYGFSKIQDAKKRIQKRAFRCIDFAVTYVIFSVITYLIKTVFSGNVNSAVDESLLSVLFKAPVNQMWYLYAMVILLAVIPISRSEKSLYLILGISILAKITTWFINFSFFLPLSYLCGNSIWFVLGMVWAYRKIRLKPWMAVTVGAVFSCMAVLAVVLNLKFQWLTTLLTLCGIIGAVEIIRLLTDKKEKPSWIWRILSQYMYQIYLLHTICAAGIRIVLLALDITNFWIHLVFGLIFSFAVPIVCAVIAEKSKILNIVFFPTKTLQTIVKKK